MRTKPQKTVWLNDPGRMPVLAREVRLNDIPAYNTLGPTYNFRDDDKFAKKVPVNKPYLNHRMIFFDWASLQYGWTRNI